jgi:hypothetical protein
MGRPKVDLSIARLYLHSPAPRPALRIGVLLDGPQAAACFRAVLADIRASGFAEIACVVYNERRRTFARPGPGLPWIKSLRHVLRGIADRESRAQLAYRAYERLIDVRYRRPSAPTEKVDCSDVLEGIPALRVRPNELGYVDRFPVDAVEQIRGLDLDVLLRFGFRILRGEILQAARYGVWSFHHGDSERYRGGPAMAWELIERNPVSGVVLQRLDEQLDAGIVLCKALFATTPTPSVTENRFAPFWGSSHFVIRKLHELHRDGWDSVLARAGRPTHYSGRKPIYRTPANRDVLGWLGTRALRTLWSRRRPEDGPPPWRIGVRRAETPLFRHADSVPVDQFRWLDNPAGRYWADPYLFEHDGRTWLFFEDCTMATRKGVIGCAELRADGTLGPAMRVLERPYHLSFPQLFREGETIYLLPESDEAGVVELYRATRFPDEWVPDRRLLELRGVDPTIVRHENRWWLFVSPTVVSGHAPLTLLFSAATLDGPWRHEVSSPIASDVRVSRAAGAIIRDGERLLRPSQDCSLRYGRALVFSEITQLNADGYAELVCNRLEPLPGSRVSGVHTYNRAGAWEAIDGQFEQ